MDPSHPLVIYTDARVGVVFGLVLTAGAVFASVYFLLLARRPLRGLRVLALAGVLVIGSAACAYLLLKRSVEIDPGAREVRELRQVLGVGPSRRRMFEQIAAVSVSRFPEDAAMARAGFALALDTADGRVELRRFDDVPAAEGEALRLAALGGWKALRRGYRLESAPSANEPQTFETARGRHGLLFDFDRFVRVLDSTGEESAIETPWAPELRPASNR